MSQNILQHNMRILLLIFLLSYCFAPSSSQTYNAIFSFGDSISDTGNLCIAEKPSSLTVAQRPYGETFFGRPTCRCSDGRLVVDFLAEAFGLPLLPPSKGRGKNFQRGANMAIIGATSLDFAFFQSIGLGNKIRNNWVNGPLDTQIQWFEQLRSSICSTAKNCRAYLRNSLFVVGEFGGNDYNANVFSGRSPDVVRRYVPNVINAISNGVEKLINLGAVDLVVPGVLPIGCFPLYLTLFPSSNQGDYDQNGCLIRFNSLSTYHNSLLRQALARLQNKYPSTRIMYGDFYNQIMEMVQNPKKFGFRYALRTCCGAGQGTYNYNKRERCGMSGASACPNPSSYLSWDGIHLTEAAYRYIANGWLRGPYCNPPILR